MSMKHKLKFNSNKSLVKLAQDTIAASKFKIAYRDKSTTDKCFYLVKDDGIYLMNCYESDNADSKLGRDRPNSVVYASGLSVTLLCMSAPGQPYYAGMLVDSAVHNGSSLPMPDPPSQNTSASAAASASGACADFGAAAASAAGVASDAAAAAVPRPGRGGGPDGRGGVPLDVRALQ